MIEEATFHFQEDDPEEFLNGQFSQEDRIYLNSAAKLGYQLAIDTVRKDASWLMDLRGGELLPRIKSHGVEYMVVQYIKNNLLDLNYQIEYTAKRNNSFIVFSDSQRKSNLIINQSASKKRPSKYAKYRANRYNNFESYLDVFSGEFVNEKPVYIELNHGYQTDVPSFIVLGIPKNSKNWYTSIPIDEEFEMIQSDTKSFKTIEKELSDFNFDDFREFVKESDING